MRILEEFKETQLKKNHLLIFGAVNEGFSKFIFEKFKDICEGMMEKSLLKKIDKNLENQEKNHKISPNLKHIEINPKGQIEEEKYFQVQKESPLKKLDYSHEAHKIQTPTLRRI